MLLKTLCRNLIMWDDVRADKNWILTQIPSLVREIYESDI